MTRTIEKIFIVLVLAVSLIGCRYNYTPVTYQTLDSMLTSGRLEYYGAFYQAEGVKYDVVCLDLYSKGLGLNKQGKMEGVGTNLYIGDIFVTTATPKASKASDYLHDDEYVCDSTVDCNHFLHGLDYDGNYGGSYVLLMGESGYEVLPVTQGQMVVNYVDDTLVIDGQVRLKGQKKTYPFHYRNTISVIHRER